ncbi:MAG: hypothetical protein LIR50_11505 [Bacillota bacterium]|nr:hypothetical protein [Bacillota bacterium]
MKDISKLSLKISILAIILTIISDFILIGKPNSSYSFFKLGTESMALIPMWRITLGTFLGIVVIPLQGLGLIAVYYSLRNGGKIKALITVLTIFHASCMAVAFHMSYAYIGSGWQLLHQVGKSNLYIKGMMNKFNYFWTLILIIIGIEIIVSSGIFSWMIIKKDTLYPKWMAGFNPGFTLVYTYLIILIMPYPIGGFLAPAFLNISTLIFMTLSLTVIGKNKAASNGDC